MWGSLLGCRWGSSRGFRWGSSRGCRWKAEGEEGGMTASRLVEKVDMDRIEMEMKMHALLEASFLC